MRFSDLKEIMRARALARELTRDIALLWPARDLSGFAVAVLTLFSLILLQQQLGAPASAALPRATLVMAADGVTRKTPALATEEKKTPEQIKEDASIFQKELAMSNHELLHRWDKVIAAASKRFGVSEDIIRAVMIQESGGRTMLSETRKWISNKGAMGLMQIMPETWRELAAQHGFGNDPFNAEDNINAGAAYLKWLHGKYGMKGMFAAYNAGPLRLEQALADPSFALPDETQGYVAGIARSLGLELADVSPGLGMLLVEKPIDPSLAPAPIAVEVKLTENLAPAPQPAVEEYWLSRRDTNTRNDSRSCAYSTSPSPGCDRRW